MSGSRSALIVIPIVAITALAVMLIMVFNAARYPEGGTGRKSIWLETRLYWAPAILLLVGWFSFWHYSHSRSPDFYATAAAVIATLYVAIAFIAFPAKDPPGGEITFEHWVFMAASTAGLLASLRGLSVHRLHYAWQKEILTALTVVGVTAAVLFVADRLIAWRVAGTRKAVVWTMVFIAVAIGLAIFP